jgi:dTDP-4-amino-4,6-dideoxygalactose transaminase
MPIRLSKSTIGTEEKAAVLAVLEKEFLGMGKEVQLFEQELAAFLNVDDSSVICVNTGTSALHLALQAVGVGPGDEVLVPSITYVASLQAISATGAKPVICDVKKSDIMIDIDDALSRISPKTKAIMPVHYASNCGGMREVYDFAQMHGLRVIEDAAHSIGSARGGKPVGYEGDVICFSFDGIKNITSGEGGAVVSSDSKLCEKVRDARLLGVAKDTEKRFNAERSWQFDVYDQGYRYHMSNIMAAIGRVQLQKLPHFSQLRRNLAKQYQTELADVAEVELIPLDYTDITPHIFVIKVLGGKRDALKAYLQNRGIESGIHYQPNHLLSYYRTEYALPASEKLYTQLLTLPLHSDLTIQEVIFICNELRDFLGTSDA